MYKWDINHIDSHKTLRISDKYDYELSIQPIASNQYSTGRCWLFASLNCMRIPFIKQYNLDNTFKFSANYLFFWDKYERCKYFLTMFPKIKKTKDTRLYHNMLYKPITDAGQWHMFVNLIKKYGIVPDYEYKETYISNDSTMLNQLLNNKLKESIVLNINIENTMAEIYNILVKYLGEPPNEFIWKGEKMSPQMFNAFHIEPYFDVNSYVNIINDPRNPYYQTYTVEHMTNMTHCDGPLYYNLPMEDLICYAQDAIKLDIPVWIACDVSKFTSRSYCVSGPSFYKDKNEDSMTKSERLHMLDSALTHAMVLHGFSNKKQQKWKIENSWGVHGINGGYYVADSTWVNEYVYQVIVPRKVAKRVPKRKGLKLRKLPLWDPFGMLA